MKSINTYYLNEEQLRSFIVDEKISNSTSLLIQVFSALNDKNFISTLLSQLRSYLPDAVVIGSTTDGEIMDGQVSEGKVVLNFTQFEHTTLHVSAIEHQENGYKSGQYLAKELIDNDTQLLISFVDGMKTNGEEFLNGISSINDSVLVAGGLAGDNFEFSKTFVFTKNRIIEHGAVGVSLNSKHLHVHTSHSFNWYPIGKELTVTKAEGNRVYTIDGKSTVDVYAHYLGEDIKENLPGIGIEFPLIVNRNGLSMARTMMSKDDDGSLLMAGSLYTGEKVHIGFGSSHGILEKSETILDEVSQKPSEVIFVYSCTARRHFMGDKIETEILPMQTIAPVSGFFTYGEFFTSNQNNLLNQTMTVISLSESDTVHKFKKPNRSHKSNSYSISFDALTHLVNITREELEESIQLGEQLKERMELALIGSNDGVWDWNIIDNSIYFSPRWKEMLGFRDAELANEFSTWESRVHNNDIDKAWADIEKNINAETEYYENIHRLKHKDGHWVWILDRGKTLFDKNGKAVRMIGTHTDITEEKENQLTLLDQAQTIKQLKERQELALIGSKTSVLDWDFTDNSLYISPSWKEMLGFRDEELPNSTHTWEDRVHPNDLKVVLSLLRKNQEEQIRYFENTHRLKHKNGHWLWVLGRAQILYDKNGKKIRMIGTHTDITDEKELQLRYSYQAQIIEQIHDGIIATDMDGNIVSWNEGAEKLFEYNQGEVIGKHISLLYPQDEMLDLKNNIRASLHDTGLYKGDLNLVKKSKDTVSVALSLSTLKDDNGKAIGMIGINQDITQRKKAEDALYKQKNILRYQVMHDALTGLPNRLLFKDRLEHGINVSDRHASGLAVFFIDLDKFKQINDSLGHDVGDSVLKAVSKRLKGVIRKEDTLARLGGDEFTIIMDELKHSDDAKLLANKILHVLAEPMYIGDHVLYVTGSIGISLYPKDADNAQYLLKYADTAMYKAKEEGRNTILFYSSTMTQRALDYMAMKTSLQQAIDNDELVIHYQPQINITTKKLLGLEALIRWNHPVKGLLYPDSFIPLAEESGLILEIDKWVMKTAMKQVSKWYKSGLNPGVLAVNLSIKQFECGNFHTKVQKRLEKYNFDPQWLELEITEGQMMKKPEEVIMKLNKINDLGVRISIDDFGTGYSSLLLLKRLPIHRLKIDRSFIQDVPKDEEDIAIIKAIIALARSLNLELIAEGVETKEQKDFLIANKCTNIQGYYYSKALPAKEMKKILLSHTW